MTLCRYSYGLLVHF